MSSKRTSSAAWMRGVTDMLAAKGLDAANLCAQAGIDFASLQDPHTRIEVDRVSQLWDLAVAASHNPALGLDRELAARYGNVDLVGYALASSPHLLAGFKNLNRHMALISDATRFVLQRDARGYWLALDHIGATQAVPRQRIEFSMLTLMVLCSWLTRRDIRAMAIEFIAPAPAKGLHAAYQAAFGQLPLFGQAENRLLLSEADMHAPIPTHNAELWALHEKLVTTELEQLGETRVSVRVRNEIIRLLPHKKTRREEVAAMLAMSDRTLQRRLHEESVSYQQLLDETRCQLVRQYLGDPRYSLAQIADLTGFEDQSNLFRACKRWFDMPPLRYRESLAAQAKGLA